MKAYVLAAGYATRMYPLTRDVPKALLEVGGAPILTHIVRRLRGLEGLTEIVVATNERFFLQFANWCTQQERTKPLTILNDGTTSDDNRLGAIGDLRFALDRVPLHGENAVVVASDNLFDFDLRDIQREFLRCGHPTFLVRRVTDDSEPSRYNEVTLRSDGRVARFREKPARRDTDLTAIALYFLPAGAVIRLDEYLKDGDPDAPGHFIAWLAKRVPCYAHPLPGPWYDVGSVKSLNEARAMFGSDQ